MRAWTFDTAVLSAWTLHAAERPRVISPIGISVVRPSGPSSTRAARTIPTLRTAASSVRRMKTRSIFFPREMTSRCRNRSRSTRPPFRKVPLVLRMSSSQWFLPSHRMRA